MPPCKLASYTRFPIGKLRAVEKENQVELVKNKLEPKSLTGQLNKKRSQLKRLQARIKAVDDSLDSVNQTISSSTENKNEFMSADLIIRKQLSPTSLNDDGKIMGATRSGQRRKQQTKTVAMQIHGAMAKNMLSAYEGLLSVLNSAPLSDLKNVVVKSPKVAKKVIPKIVRKNITDFENTKVNFTRSVNVLYRGGIASKAKYCQIRSS